MWNTICNRLRIKFGNISTVAAESTKKKQKLICKRLEIRLFFLQNAALKNSDKI